MASSKAKQTLSIFHSSLRCYLEATVTSKAGKIANDLTPTVTEYFNGSLRSPLDHKWFLQRTTLRFLAPGCSNIFSQNRE